MLTPIFHYAMLFPLVLLNVLCVILNGEKTEMVWARHEDGRRSRSEESDDESDTREKEERETKDKVEGCVQEGHADCRTERGR